MLCSCRVEGYVLPMFCDQDRQLSKSCGKHLQAILEHCLAGKVSDCIHDEAGI